MSFNLQSHLFACSALLALGSCAATDAKTQPTSQGAEPRIVQSNFEDGVVEVCGKYFQSDLDIKISSKNTNLNLKPLRAGSRYPGGIVLGMPVHAASDGVVHIKENLINGTCEVSAYGIPVEATFENISTSLLSYGYTEEQTVKTPENTIRRVFEKVSDDVTVIVTLSGVEPGTGNAISRFSTVIGYVGYKDAK